MIQDILRQLSSHRAACKNWSVIVSIAIFVAGALARLNTMTLLWAAAPLVLLAFAEAGYAARQEYLAEQANAGKAADQSKVLPSPPAMAGLRGFASALGSLSIWPFYLALWGVFVAGAFNLPRSAALGASSAEASATVVGAAQPAVSGVNNGLPGYPPGVVPRYPNGAPYTGPLPGYPGVAARTPGPGFPRPATPVNFGPRPPVRPAFTPAALPPAAPSTPLAPLAPQAAPPAK